MDEETASQLERVEVLLSRAGALAERDRSRARAVLLEAHALAREVGTAGGEVTIPATLEALLRTEPRPAGYWLAQAEG